MVGGPTEARGTLLPFIEDVRIIRKRENAIPGGHFPWTIPHAQTRGPAARTASVVWAA